MDFLKKLSKVLSENIGIIIVALSTVAFFKPPIFSWAISYTAALLGIAMFGMGLTIKLEDFKILLKRPIDIFIGCLAQFTVMPFLAYALAKAFNLSPDLAIGVILVGCCPGGTASNVITYIAKGDMPLSVGMTMASTLIAPLVTPVLVYMLGGAWVEVSLVAMMISTVKIVLIPIVVGIFIHEAFRDMAVKLNEVFPIISVCAIVLLIASIVGCNASKLMSCGLMVCFVVMLHNVAGMAMGYMLARVLKMNRRKTTAITIEVGMQNSGLAISLAAVHFAANPLATIPGAIFSVWHNISGSIFANVVKNGNEECIAEVNEELGKA